MDTGLKGSLNWPLLLAILKWVTSLTSVSWSGDSNHCDAGWSLPQAEDSISEAAAAQAPKVKHLMGLPRSGTLLSLVSATSCPS